MNMKIKLWIDPKNGKKFIEALKELCRKHAKATEERALDGTLQEKSETQTAWFFKECDKK